MMMVHRMQHVFAALLVCVFIPIGVDAQQDERLASLYEQASETSGLVVQYENDVRATLTNQQLTRDYKPTWRSEEHTSELQSLMRISYAVFCLKNKTTQVSYEHR